MKRVGYVQIKGTLAGHTSSQQIDQGLEGSDHGITDVRTKGYQCESDESQHHGIFAGRYPALVSTIRFRHLHHATMNGPQEEIVLASLFITIGFGSNLIL